ncbi:MAG: rod shape-determining protein MreD [Gammaproteobacteria bacterium]|nr:rod shape-determining protein MreD [Gammaproteobacteria bacterium]
MIHVRNWWIVPFTVICALMFSQLPIPQAVTPAIPTWTTLVVIYWATFLTPHFGVISGFIIGILLDVTDGVLLGQNAFVLTIIVFIVRHQAKRIATAPMVQQVFLVAMFEGVRLLLLLAVNFFLNRRPVDFSTYFLSCFTTAIIWPWVYFTFRQLQRRFDLR